MLRLFPFLRYLNNTAVNIGVQISLQDTDFISFGYIPSIGIAESYGSSILKFLRNYLTVFIAASFCIPTNSTGF